MVSNKLTQEVKRHAVVVAIDAKNGDGDTARFLEVARSSLHEVRKGLDVCSEVVSPVAKNETQRTVSGHQNLYSVSAELYRCESRNVRDGDLHVPEVTIRNVGHKDIHHKSIRDEESAVHACTRTRTTVTPSKRINEKIETSRRNCHTHFLKRNDRVMKGCGYVRILLMPPPILCTLSFSFL